MKIETKFSIGDTVIHQEDRKEHKVTYIEITEGYFYGDYHAPSIRYHLDNTNRWWTEKDLIKVLKRHK